MHPDTTKDELIDYAIRTGAPLEVVENLQAIEDEETPMTLLKRSGQTTLPTTIISGMRMNINPRFWEKLKNNIKSLLEAFFIKKSPPIHEYFCIMICVFVAKQ